jgi:hypothetical protein
MTAPGSDFHTIVVTDSGLGADQDYQALERYGLS